MRENRKLDGLVRRQVNPQPAPPAEPVTAKPPRKAKKILLILTVITLVVIGLGIWLYLKAPSNPIPKNIRQSASFSLFYPQNTPLDKNSIQLTNNNSLLSYTLHNQGDILYVTEQPRPQDFNFDDFNKQLSGSVQFITTNGTATVGKFNGRIVGSMPTSDTWILVSSTLNTPTDDLSQVLKQLTEAPRH